jgi:hypothetical protein
MLPIEIYAVILKSCSVNTIRNFIVNKSIQNILDFNFWIDKFKSKNYLIFALTLPNTASDWMYEYHKTKCVYKEYTIIRQMTDNVHIYYDSLWKFSSSRKVLKYAEDCSVNSLLILLPSNCSRLSFLTNIKISIDFSNITLKVNFLDLDETNLELLLLRTLYYFPNLPMKEGKLNLKKKHIIDDLKISAVHFWYTAEERKILRERLKFY